MKALHNNRLSNVVETGSDITLADDGRQVTVSFGDGGPVVDPTDQQVADADDLAQWYGLDHEAARNPRAMLRGELSSGQWQKA